MCFGYEIRVPENYTALSGDLDILIIDLLRSPLEDVRLELLEVEYVRRENVKLKKPESGTLESRSTPEEVDKYNHLNDSLTILANLSALNKSVEFNKTPLMVPARTFHSSQSQIPQIEVERKWTVIHSSSVPFSNDSRSVRVKFPCGVVTRGGHFGVRLTGHDDKINNLTLKTRGHACRKSERTSCIEKFENNRTIVGLDVRWPRSALSLFPHHVETYPEESVMALLQFESTKCLPAEGRPSPETWLDLLFCSHTLTGCAEGNATHRQVIYSEQIRGYPKRRSIVLRCELFGSAGYFTLALRSSVETGAVIETDNKEAFLKAAWSDHYIFNVHARSIFPCDVHGGGVPVLFQYPKCILKGDRIRLFSRLRADVSSLVPPTSLHYVTEKRVVKGKHSLQFDCDFFTEKYVEYCFVYVSQAITGAVSDVRMDCVPTLPIYDSDSGNWGAWSAWSTCTTTCGGGTRNRFRYCDSPPPRYGAKFCEGHSVETEGCANTNWDCEFYQNYLLIDSENKGASFPADRPEVLAEVGPGCRCGCVIHLGAAKPRRLLATSSQSCPGRIFWQIEADKEHIIKFSVEHFRFPCGSQWLKIRDGDSRSSTLIGELSRSHATSIPVISTGPKLLIEFFSDELLAAGQDCWGGFMAHAQQSQISFANTSRFSSGFTISKILRNMEVAATASTSLFLVHSFVAAFVCLVIIISGCLGIQYIFRYRKYQLAAAAEDAESAIADSQSSLVVPANRATSNSTLLSEVISLQRFKPTKYKHCRLREDPDLEEAHLSESSDFQPDDGKTPSSSLKTLKPDTNDSSSSTPVCQRDSPSLTNTTQENLLDQNNTTSSLTEPNRETYSCSSSENGKNTCSIENGNIKESILRFLHRRRQSLSTSSIRSESTLTNEYTSPPSSTTSTGPRNPKAKKEKKNLEKLLAGSEFSLSADGDLELDYYDYNVQNASAVPESYIGMDPAYLVWIPPFSPVEWDESSKEKSDEERTEMYDHKEKKFKNKEIVSKRDENNKENGETILDEVTRGIRSRQCEIHKSTERCLCSYENLKGEKETRVEKSPSESSDYYRVMVDIKFADEDEEDCATENAKIQFSCHPKQSKNGTENNDHSVDLKT
ncbi:hypothetical protein RUM43_013860 [Polyplax serrata]|uniref:CUB domain-containing protein n=1 Tax=Polyplax serrata TaxID=468196 RepID=A0AAN8S9L2_POLSC